MKRHYTPQCLAHVEKILEAFPAQRQQLPRPGSGGP